MKFKIKLFFIEHFVSCALRYVRSKKNRRSIFLTRKMYSILSESGKIRLGQPFDTVLGLKIKLVSIPVGYDPRFV